ncbi:hypothetical protein ACOSQ4_000252 [Xanthoceras sorbifolium]
MKKVLSGNRNTAIRIIKKFNELNRRKMLLRAYDLVHKDAFIHSETWAKNLASVPVYSQLLRGQKFSHMVPHSML